MNLHTKTLMVASAVFMAALGLGASFLPHETLAYAGNRSEGLSVVLLQITGALYMSYALVNWTASGSLIGGIYGRPLALGNFMHFAIVTIVLVKSLSVLTTTPILIAAATYATFAVWFGLVLFTHPASSGEPRR